MQRGSPSGSIIGGIGLLALDAVAVSYGRLPTWGYFRGPLGIDLAKTPGLFWASVGALACVGVAAIIWGFAAMRRR